MRNKGLIIIILVVLVGIGGYFVWKNTIKKQNKTDSEVVKIGAILPLTGEAATYGIRLKKGMDLALKEINSKNPKLKFEIIYEDGKGNPSTAISAYNKLKSANNINYVIGGMFSNVALSLAPIVEKDKVILMSPTASSVEYSKYGDYLFRIYPSDSYDGVFLSKFVLEKLKVNSVAIISVDAASTTQITNVFVKNFKSLKGKIELVDFYKQGTKNYRTILQKLKTIKSEVVFIPGYIEDIALFLKQAKELNISKTFLTISTVYDKKIFDIAGTSAEGLIFSAPAYDINSTKEEVRKFVKSFSNEYKEKPDILGAYGYDVVNISYKVLTSPITNKTSEITKGLYKIKNFKGITGNTSFDDNGDVIKELNIVKVKNNSFIKY